MKFVASPEPHDFSRGRSQLHLEAPIVGGEYVRRGDHPAPKFLEETLSVMASEGTIFFVSGRDGIREVVFWPNGDPDLSVFSPEEADIIERWCSPDVSPTRKTVWKCVDEGETVPYELGFIAEPRPLTERETEIGLAVAAFYGLLKKKTASKMSAEQVAKIEAYHKERGWEVPRELWTVSRLRGAKNRA
jgi:hypothetical protein